MENVILEEKENVPPCLLPWYTMNINSDGSITPCAQWPKEDGAKLNGRSLKEIWFKDFEKMRKTIIKKLYLNGVQGVVFLWLMKIKL